MFLSGNKLRSLGMWAAAGALLTASGATQGDAATLRIATTTSTDNSGLMQYLLPEFTESNGVQVHTVVVGTGRALKHAENGDVDAVLVHSESAELALVERGDTINRQEVMYNEFIVVGPADDPAGVAGSETLAAAFEKIQRAGSAFVSRGDDSGTHKKELEIWDSAGLRRDDEWYKDVGQGMGRTLDIADELRAYTLTDKGTWLFLKDKLNLPALVDGSADGRNVYGVMAVNPKRHPQVNSEHAAAFIDWLTSTKTKRLIADYRVNGEQLFYPIN